MEVQEKTLPIVDNPDENGSKKGKILTLLFPAESQPADGKEVKKDKNKPSTKVVIRRLPPKLTKDGFVEEFSPLPAHDYFHFVRGDLNLGPHAFSRAYINFLNEEDIFSFKEKFDDFDIQDDKGKTYHAVVEFAPFQKIPRRNILKKKLSKAGTLESDPKYIEFLQKLEESKNFISNPSEYFHETENSALKTKVVTTPLLEFLKRKKQKKIDYKNELRQRKREVEREKKRKEEEKRKLEREKRKEERRNLDKNKNFDEKGKKIEERVKEKKNDERTRVKEEKKDSKNLDNESAAEENLDSVIPNDPAILEVVVRHFSSDREPKPGAKTITFGTEEVKSVKSNESDTNVGKPDRKYTDFRTRLAEEKQRKAFYKRDLEESKTVKGNRKGVPDEKGDNYSIGNCSDLKETGKKLETDSETKRHEYKVEMKETKSKFRYSEQRNRDREYRQKTSDCKTSKGSGVDVKNKVKDPEDKGTIKVSNLSEETVRGDSSGPEPVDGEKNSSTKTDQISLPSRRKSLEMEREVVDTERKRSKSFHDVSSKEFCAFQTDKKIERQDSDRTREVNTPESESVQADDNSKESTESEKMDEESKKDKKVERRIRNKDRPSIEIYRPGMGKFSKQRLEQKREDRNSTSPTGKSSSFASKAYKKPQNLSESVASYKCEESGGGGGGGGGTKSNAANGKTTGEIRTITFTRSTSKEN